MGKRLHRKQSITKSLDLSICLFLGEVGKGTQVSHVSSVNKVRTPPKKSRMKRKEGVGYRFGKRGASRTAAA